MKLFTGLTRIAHIPPHANVVDLNDGKRGYWIEHSEGDKLFLDHKTNRILLPKSLHGKTPNDVSKNDFAAIPKEDSGKEHYKMFMEDFNKKQSANKLFNGFEFTDSGKILIDRLKKFIIKSKLDNMTNFGLDMKYSLKPELFDKLMEQTSIDKVHSLAKAIGKKYRIATELIRESGKPKIANKIDGDFYYHWNKLINVFEFDPSSYSPQKTTSELDEVEEKSQTETIQNIANSFLEEVRNIADPQMGDFMNSVSDFMKVIGKNNIPLAQEAYKKMASILMLYIGRYHGHPVSQASERILQLPSFVLLHHKLHVDSSV